MWREAGPTGSCLARASWGTGREDRSGVRLTTLTVTLSEVCPPAGTRQKRARHQRLSRSGLGALTFLFSYFTLLTIVKYIVKWPQVRSHGRATIATVRPANFHLCPHETLTAPSPQQPPLCHLYEFDYSRHL